MSRSAHQELLRRRERLLIRSGHLRETWSLQVQWLRAPLGLADRARAATSWLANNPQWPLGAMVVIVLLRPVRALRWATYAWQGAAVYRRVQRLFGGSRRPLV